MRRASQSASQQRPPRSGRPSQFQEEEENITQTQGILSAEETNKLVAELMRHMLFKNYQQPGVPVSRAELSSLITKNYKQRDLPSHVIRIAQRKLSEVFGLEMKEYNRLRSQTKSGRGSLHDKQAEAKWYVLRSMVPADLRKEFIETPESAALNSLATVVIGIIKCAGEKCSEEVLWQNLKRLDIREDDLDHPIFGNVKNAVENLAKQRYIQKEKLTSGEGDVYELAERALDEQCLSGLGSFMLSVRYRREVQIRMDYKRRKFNLRAKRIRHPYSKYCPRWWLILDELATPEVKCVACNQDRYLVQSLLRWLHTFRYIHLVKEVADQYLNLPCKVELYPLNLAFTKGVATSFVTGLERKFRHVGSLEGRVFTAPSNWMFLVKCPIMNCNLA